MKDLNKEFDKKFIHGDQATGLACDFTLELGECNCQLKEILSFIRQREKDLLDEIKTEAIQTKTSCLFHSKKPDNDCVECAFVEGTLLTADGILKKLKELSNE